MSHRAFFSLDHLSLMHLNGCAKAYGYGFLTQSRPITCTFTQPQISRFILQSISLYHCIIPANHKTRSGTDHLDILSPLLGEPKRNRIFGVRGCTNTFQAWPPALPTISRTWESVPRATRRACARRRRGRPPSSAQHRAPDPPHPPASPQTAGGGFVHEPRCCLQKWQTRHACGAVGGSR